MADEFKYWAFISYSHQDNLAQRKNGATGCVRWAEWLLQALETYRVPTIFRGRLSASGEKVPERLFPVFQDEKELPLNSDLAHVIEEGLRQSRFLIVICSPHSASSFYVNEEVRLFKAMGRQNRILALIVSGEPNASDGNKSWVAPSEECFCPALRHPLVAGEGLNARLDLSRRDSQEPIAGDVRLKRDQLAAEVRQSELRGHQEVLDFMKLKLIAGLIGVGFDELVQRDKARQAAEWRRRIAILGAVALGVGVLAIYAFFERNRATKEATRANQSERRISENASQSHYELAKLLLEREEVPGALAHLAESLRNWPENRVATSFALNLLLHREWPIPAPSPLGSEVKLIGAVLNADSSRLLTWPGKNQLFVWDAKTGKSTTPSLVSEGNVLGADFSRDGKRVLTTANDGFARIWDANSGAELRKLEVPGKLAAFWASDETRLLTIKPGASARIWNALTGEPFAPDLPHEKLSGGELSQDGARVLTASGDGVVRIWNAVDGMELGAPIRHNDVLLASNFSTDGERVITSGTDGVVRISSAASGEKLGELKHVDPVWAARSTPVGERLVTRSTDGSIRIWESQGLTPWCGAFNPGGLGFGVSMSTDGSRLLVPAHGQLKIWNIATGRVQAEPMVRQALLTSGNASADQTRVVTASWDGAVRVWDSRSGQLVLGPLKQGAILNGASFSPAGNRILSYAQDGTIRIWDAQTGAALGTTMKMPGRVTCAAFGPDGKRAAAGNSEGEVWVFDVESGAKIRSLEKTRGEVYALAFHKDGRRLATATGPTLYLWDLDNGARLESSMKHESSISSLMFSPDGKRLLSGSSDRSARIWDPATSKPLIDPVRHQDWITAARFSADGERFVTASKDGMIRVWESASGRPLAALGPLSGRMALGREALSAAFSSDDRGLIVVLPGGVCRLDVAGWGQATEELAQLIESLGGQRWNSGSGRLEGVPEDQFEPLRKSFVNGSAVNEVATVGRWFFAERKTRSISPWSGLSMAQWSGRRLADESVLGSPAVLEEMLLVNPRDPAILRALAAKVREKEPGRGRHLELMAGMFEVK